MLPRPESSVLMCNGKARWLLPHNLRCVSNYKVVQSCLSGIHNLNLHCVWDYFRDNKTKTSNARCGAFRSGMHVYMFLSVWNQVRIVHRLVEKKSAWKKQSITSEHLKPLGNDRVSRVCIGFCK